VVGDIAQARLVGRNCRFERCVSIANYLVLYGILEHLWPAALLERYMQRGTGLFVARFGTAGDAQNSPIFL
jgi:hypothetical protein